MKIYHVDGQFVPADKAVIPVDDLSVLRGYGVCDIMRTFRGKPYFLDEHIDRLVNSAREIGLSLPWSNEEIKLTVLETLQRNRNVDQVNIRIIITGGSSPDYFYPQGPPRLIIMITDMKKLPLEWYSQGIKVITHPQERLIPDAKVTAYIPAALALKKAKKLGAVEAIYVNSDGQVLEGTTSNLFMFTNNTLVTPDREILKGITREAVISISQQLFQTLERPVLLTELLAADEVFISGTNKGVVPVVKVDENLIGTGKPGPNTLKIMKKLIEDQEIMS